MLSGLGAIFKDLRAEQLLNVANSLALAGLPQTDIFKSIVEQWKVKSPRHLKNRPKLTTFHVDLVSNMLQLSMHEEDSFKELISEEYSNHFYNTQKIDPEVEVKPVAAETEVTEDGEAKAEVEEVAKVSFNPFEIGSFTKMVTDNVEHITAFRLKRLIMMV